MIVDAVSSLEGNMEPRSIGITRRSALLLLSGVVLAPAMPSVVYAAQDAVKLGNRTVTIRVVQNGQGPLYVCPHQNEVTGAKAAEKMVRAHGGTFIQLVHNGERNISFTHDGAKYVFDPNRMFTNKGIEATLKAQGKNYSKEAHALVHALAERYLLNFFFGLVGAAPLVAVHNNTNNNYSIESYLPGGSEASAAKDVFINDDHDPDDFFFTTSTRTFAELKAKGWNVALQARGGPDDGSLSVFAVQNNVTYVNVEAQAGHQSVQEKMLKALL